MKTLTAKQKQDREKEIKAMVDSGASLNDMAKHFDLTQQAVHKFLKVRGWKTAEANRRAGVEPEEDGEAKKKAEAKARRAAMKQPVDRS